MIEIGFVEWRNRFLGDEKDSFSSAKLSFASGKVKLCDCYKYTIAPREWHSCALIMALLSSYSATLAP